MLNKLGTLTGTLKSKIPAMEIGILLREPTRLQQQEQEIHLRNHLKVISLRERERERCSILKPKLTLRNDTIINKLIFLNN